MRNQLLPVCPTSTRLSKCSIFMSCLMLMWPCFRYLVPNDLSAYHFNYIIRKRIKLPEKDSLYFFVNGKFLLKGGKLVIFSWQILIYIFLYSLDTLMLDVYEKKADEDGFLYITYTDETTLGASEEKEWDIFIAFINEEVWSRSAHAHITHEIFPS